MPKYGSLLNLNSQPIQEVLERMSHHPRMMEGKVAIVTGAARGIGEQTAIVLAYLGAKLAATPSTLNVLPQYL